MAVKNEIPVSVLLQYFRVPTGELPVDYAGRDMLLVPSITNISTTGVFIRTPKPCPTGTEVDITFSLPKTTRAIQAHTVVRWSLSREQASFDPGSPYGMGLEFVRMAPAHRKAIARYVEEFLHRMRKE